MTELSIDLATVRVLVLDPEPARRDELVAVLQQSGCRTVAAYATVAELPAPSAPTIDVALLDLGDGGTAPGELRCALASETPIIGLTGDDSPEGRRRAAESGVADFALRPVGAAELRLRVTSALAGKRLRRLLHDRSVRLSEALREATVELDTVRESLAVLAAMADYHDDDSDRHAQRVGLVAAAIADALSLPTGLAHMIRDAAPLHDIGKVGISRRILLKSEKLTPPEWLHMQQHVDIGGQILASSESPVLRLAAEIARTHHERWDGSGYTAGLSGEEIPISGRIVAVADVWDTLTHDRPYRRAWDPAHALAEIRSGAGTHFDPAVVEAFCGVDLDALTRPADGNRRAA